MDFGCLVYGGVSVDTPWGRQYDTDRTNMHKERDMAGYIIGDIEITDPDRYTEYRGKVPETVAKYGGEFLVRGGAAESLEGDWNPNRIVVLKFESVARAKEWYNSGEYQAIIGIRQGASNGNVVVVEGA